MTEWWTYSLRDLLLFSPRTYYRLFELYNIEWWPLQFVFFVLGAIVLVLWQQRSKMAAQALAVILALCWLWVAWAYHWQRYAQINWAANYYALAFALEAILLLWLGVVRVSLSIEPYNMMRQRIGLGLFIFAWLCYPLIAPLFGRNWTQSEILGMTPDPTALATLSILLFSRIRPLWLLLPIPASWCFISGTTLWTMNSPDFVIPSLGALLVIVLAIFPPFNSSTKHTQK